MENGNPPKVLLYVLDTKGTLILTDQWSLKEAADELQMRTHVPINGTIQKILNKHYVKEVSVADGHMAYMYNKHKAICQKLLNKYSGFFIEKKPVTAKMIDRWAETVYNYS